VPDIVIHGIASAAYLVLAWHFWHTRWRAAAPPAETRRMSPVWERAALLAPIALHGWLLHSGIFAAAELRFGFAQALSVMMFLAVLMCWLEGFFYPIEALYPLLLAAAALCAPLPAFFPGRLSPDAVSFEFRVHLVFGMLAYSLFTVAMLHAVLIAKVENRLHAAPGLGGPLAQLPPLLSLERLVFALIAAAFVVLTVTLAFGIVYSEAFLGRAMRFEHKTVFVVLSWLIFGLLLGGRWRYGWRGRTALRWTLTGFVLLMLAYPGSRFVLEVLLHRA
jgi:ABC-type uncharacterized transport system permease subunit